MSLFIQSTQTLVLKLNGKIDLISNDQIVLPNDFEVIA